MRLRAGMIVEIAATVLFVAGMVVLAVFADRDRGLRTCSDIEVSFNDTLRFVGKDDVKRIIERDYGCYLGQRMDSVDLYRIEEILVRDEMITGCQAWMTSEGMLHIEIDRRKPVLRFIPDQGKGFYIDGEGAEFSLHPEYTADVPVLCGQKPEGEEWIEGVLDLFGHLSEDWNGRIAGVRIDKKTNIEIKGAEFDETVLYGTASDNSEKLKKLKKYLQEIKPLGNEYTIVNLKYRNRIICRKDI